MPDPTMFHATLTIKAFGASPDELADRVRRAIETHPTLSFRLDEVVVEELSADGDELQVLQVGNCVGRKKAPGVILTGSQAAVVRAGRFLARQVRLHGVGS